MLTMCRNVMINRHWPTAIAALEPIRYVFVARPLSWNVSGKSHQTNNICADLMPMLTPWGVALADYQSDHSFFN